MSDSSANSSQNINVGDVLKSHVNVAQGVEGNLTQIQGQVVNVTVYDQLQTVTTSQPARTTPTPALSQQEYRQRQVLLNKVNQFWVEDVLERSLHARAVIELGLEERFDTLQHPFEQAETVSEDSVSQTLPVGTPVEAFFAELGAGRTLLILGEPGSGKTIMLLKLAKSLIAQTTTDLSQPIPVVFNLSSWSSPHKPIATWLVDELNTKYQVSKPLAKTWIEQQALILLLDGLDEVSTHLQDDCVQAINQFLQEHGQTETIVCSRIQDYLALPSRLQLQGALYLQSLTDQQIEQYLNCAGTQLDTVKTLLQQDRALQEMARSPLTLSIMTLAYQGKSVADIPQTGSLEERRRHLLDAYVERMFQRKGGRSEYPEAKVKQQLSWLAQQMVYHSQTVFLIEDIQPAWLPTRKEQRLYQIGIRLVLLALWGAFHVGLLAGHGSDKLTFSFADAAFGGLLGVLGGVVYGVVRGLSVGLVKGIGDRLLNGLLLGGVFGPIFELSYGGGVAFTCIYAVLGIVLYDPFNTPIDPVEISKISWGKVKQYSLVALVVAIALYVGTTAPLAPSLLIGLAVLLMVGFERVNQVEPQTLPNQGIWKSATNVRRMLMLFGPLFGLLFGLLRGVVSGFVNGIILGLASGLIGAQNSGIICVKHLVLRMLVWWRGYAPWNYAQFLDYATDRIFMQKVGGGYIFVHRLLLEYFASLREHQEM